MEMQVQDTLPRLLIPCGISRMGALILFKSAEMNSADFKVLLRKTLGAPLGAQRAGSSQPGGQVISRPESTWKCRCRTLCPACSPMLETTR